MLDHQELQLPTPAVNGVNGGPLQTVNSAQCVNCMSFLVISNAHSVSWHMHKQLIHHPPTAPSGLEIAIWPHSCISLTSGNGMP